MAKQVRDIMTPDVTTLGRNDSLQVVKDIMTLGRVRHFPVIDDGKVVGVVSQRDLYKASLGSVMKYGEKAQRAFLEGIAVKEVMCEPVITIAPHASVKEAARLQYDRQEDRLFTSPGRPQTGWYRDRNRYAQTRGRHRITALT